MSQNYNPYAGLIVPLITPFNEQGQVDHPAVDRLVDHLLRVKLAALMVAGTTGESMALPANERIRLIQTACAAARGRVRVIAGVGSTCAEDTLAFAQAAREAGADALSLHPPSYFTLSDAEVLAYFRSMLAEVKMPLILYNIPGCTRNALSIDAVEQLKEDPRVLGIKDSSSDPDYFAQLMQRCAGDDFFVNCGDEGRIAESMLAGACGCTASLANIEPELCLRCCEAAARGDAVVAAREQAAIADIIAPLRVQGWLYMVRQIKARLAAEGICQPYMARLFHFAIAR